MDAIRSFRDDYAWLSNFYPATVQIPMGTERWFFPTAENAYQATKSEDASDWIRIATLTPGQAKRHGSKVKLRSNWNEIKLGIMTEIVTLKFNQHPELMAKLKATGSREIIEENHWGDTYWGVCAGQGDNHLGKILMAIRDQKTT
jgi:ribA/ribD-fused uncharacterized protein